MVAALCIFFKNLVVSLIASTASLPSSISPSNTVALSGLLILFRNSVISFVSVLWHPINIRYVVSTSPHFTQFSILPKNLTLYASVPAWIDLSLKIILLSSLLSFSYSSLSN
jgi:hypothetical protein